MASPTPPAAHNGAMVKALKPRRKPSQSRAWMTSGAIQDAFLISLVEAGYERVSMRDIANVAGVGLGTLYLYFPNKESIAAVTLRKWLRTLAREIAEAVADEAHATLDAKADAMVEADLANVYAHPEQWRVLLILERRVTERGVYQEMYRHFVGQIAQGFAQATDLPADQDPQHLAFIAFSVMNATVRDALLVLDALPERELLTRALQGAVRGGLDSVLMPERSAATALPRTRQS